MRQKGFAPIIILLVIVALGVLGYLAFAKGYLSVNLPKPLAIVTPSVVPSLSTTPDPTSNWKTYTSKVQNFSFKIPKELVVLESNNRIEIFLTQEALDKSKTCKPDPKEIEPLPCSPFLLDINYSDVSKIAYPSGEVYVNQVKGGMGGNPPYREIQGQGLTWTVGQGSGLDLRPTVRAFAYDEDKIRFVQTDTYILPFWQYTHMLSSANVDWSTALKQIDFTKLEDFSYEIISTFKFSQ